MRLATILLCAGLGTAAGAQSFNFETVCDGMTCYGRDCDTAHFAAHPDQAVTFIELVGLPDGGTGSFTVTLNAPVAILLTFADGTTLPTGDNPLPVDTQKRADTVFSLCAAAPVRCN